MVPAHILGRRPARRARREELERGCVGPFSLEFGRGARARGEDELGLAGGQGLDQGVAHRLIGTVPGEPFTGEGGSGAVAPPWSQRARSAATSGVRAPWRTAARRTRLRMFS